MPDVNTNRTSLKDAINICLSCLGETPVDSPNNTSTNVVLAKQIIEEVSRDVQSKGWWFNTLSSGQIYIYVTADSFGAVDNNIPEEARRYIAIRAARVLQSRFIGSEELQKFSYQEEQVSLAILTQAHVRNGGNSTSFNSFPADLKGMGVEEVMFLQQSAEEKLLSLRLVTELKSTDKLVAETALIADQEELVTKQALTEVKKALNLVAETSLKGKQGGLIDNQAATELKNALKAVAEISLIDAQELKTDSERVLVDAQATDVSADTALKGKQGFLVDAQRSQTLTESLLRSQQALTELQETAKRTREAELIDAQEALIQKQILTEAEQVAKVQEEVDLLQTQDTLVTNQASTELKKALDLVADTSLKGKQGSLVDNQAATELKNALKLVADTTLVDKQGALVDAQKTDTEAGASLKSKQGFLAEAQRSQALTESLMRSQQALTEVQNTTKVGAEKLLVDAQAATQTSQQTLLGAQATTETSQQTVLGAQATNIGADTTLKGAQATDVGADTTLKGKQGSLVDAQATDVAADTTLKGKQGSLVDAQATDVAADTTLKGKQGSLVDAQSTDVAADTTLKGKQGSLVDAQATDVAADTTLKGKQGSALDADTALKTSQKTQLDAQTAIEATAEKDFYDGVVAGTQNTYRDFAPEMRMMGIQEAQFQSTPAYKKVELIKDAEKLRKQHTESNRYRMNTRVTYANGGLRGDNVARQFYGLASTHPAYQNPVTAVSGYIWHGFNDTTGGSTGSPTASGKHLANGNPKAYNLSTNFTSGLNEDGTSFVNDTTGNAGITFAGDTFANRSFMSNYAVHVRPPNDLEVAAGKTFSVTFFVNFHQPSNDATGSYLLEAIADNTLTVYVDDVQVGVKEYQPLRWEDENTLAFDPFNWDRPQDILLTNITSGFHKVTLEFSNLTDNNDIFNIRTPDYVAGHTDDKLVGVGSNPVAVAARLRPLKSADITDDYNKANNVYTALGQDGNSLFIWDTQKQFGLGTYDESDIEVVNDVLRLIGEPPAKEFHENALAIETYNLIRKTDIELQGRGWFFNTEKDILLGTDIGVVNRNDRVATTSSVYKKKYIKVDDTDFNKGGVYDYVLSFEANDYKTQLRRLGSDDSYRVLYNTKTREIYDWFPSDGVKGTAIIHKELSTCPQKYKEYLTVRVATILTELYPQSGIDIQRLPKMEQELETYFKDIQADEANYSVFDNYDTASRIGINRNYDIS